MTGAHMDDPGPYAVVEAKCLRCATCSSLAPGIFAMGDLHARVVRAPVTASEATLCEAARIGCPGHAIARPGSPDPIGVTESPKTSEWLAEIAATAKGSLALDPLFPRLFDESERVRWRMVDVPWGAIDKSLTTPALLRFVREMAVSELTTFSATRRFLTEMADDVDFTAWAAIWFYEETKHPEALFRWLGAFGTAVDSRTVQRGRVSAPFMRSRTGTLVMNVLSELFASAGYQDLARYVQEPVLARIAKNLAGDEARHGAAFYLFADRAIATAKDPAFERLQAIKVLYYWVQANDHVEHPVNQFHEKVSADPTLGDLLRDIGTDYAPILARACRMIGALVGHPIEGPGDVRPLLRDLSGGQDAKAV